MGRTPVIAADWETDDSDDRWNMPVAFGVCKIHFFGKMSNKMGVEFQWMPIKPGFGVDLDRDKGDRGRPQGANGGSTAFTILMTKPCSTRSLFTSII